MPVMPQNEEILKLRRLNEELRTENAALVKRAARRYQDLMHANRRAERAEQALKAEAWERMDDKMKATNLFCSYKETIKTLELQVVQAQRFGRSGEQFQAMQPTDFGLEVTLESQKEIATGSQMSTSETIKELQSQVEADKTHIRKEAEQRYEQQFAEMNVQLSGEYSRKVQTSLIQMQKVVQACKAENDCLKQKLSQVSQTMDLQRRQTQQQPAEHVSQQIQRQNAGIHSGFPPPAQSSPSQYKEILNKRRRLDSVGNAAISVPDLQQDCGGSIKSNASGTPERSVRDISTQPPQQPITPTRRIATIRQQQHSNTHLGPLKHSCQSPKQKQLLPPHLQSIPQAQQLFSGFMHHLNAERLKSGQTQVSHGEALPLFHHWVLQRLNKRSPVLKIGDVTLQSVLQHSQPSDQSSSQTDDSIVGLQSPFIPVATPLSRQMIERFNKPSPSMNQVVSATHRQQSQQSHEQQQQDQESQGTLKSPGMPSRDLRNSFPAPTSDYCAVSSGMFPRSGCDVQVTPIPKNAEVKDTEREIQPDLHLQGAVVCPFPGDSECGQNFPGTSGRAQTQGLTSSAPNVESSSLDIDNIEPIFSNNDGRNFDNNLRFTSLPPSNGALTLQPTSTQTDKYGLDDRRYQQNNSVEDKSRPHQQTIDPALLLDGEANLAARNSLDEQMTNYNPSASIEYPTIGLFTSYSEHSSQKILPDLLDPRKHPVTPPSACTAPALFTHSISAPISPPISVCLHCHKNWWNESCDAGEPCQNCIVASKPCERPRCLNFAVGTCTIARCPRVHEGDLRYRNVVVRPKTLKRIGKKGEARASPSVSTYQQR